MPTPSDVRPRRILVIANETSASAVVAEEVRHRARGGAADVLVVAPLTPLPVSDEPSDPERTRAEAERRLEVAVTALAGAGLNAWGELGHADPLRALDDALGRFGPDEVLIATHPPERSNWLEQRVVQRARERYELPITHVVVDLEQERWEDEGGALPPEQAASDPPAEA